VAKTLIINNFVPIRVYTVHACKQFSSDHYESLTGGLLYMCLYMCMHTYLIILDEVKDGFP
jgi:hypothetical protein